ncbi:MAG: peptidylprolyl isomerase [Actinomycetota bacterium]|nr:peptidylprolyl isomerase [Actinomycetota bacterium]
MGTSSEKHARQKQGRTTRVADARKQVRSEERKRRIVTIVGVVLAVALLLGVAALLVQPSGSGSADSSTTTAPSDDSTTTVPDTPPAEGAAATLPAPPAGVTLEQPTPCPPAEGSAKRVQKFAGLPPTCIEPGTAYEAVVTTTKGTFTVALDSEAAPVAANNFVVLSRYRFFDGVPFHRIVPGFVIQGGDGDGEPWGNNDLGYSFGDELPAGPEAYTDYSFAMANAGPATNGSQFFVVLPGGGQQLNPANYTRFGEVTSGREVIDAIGALGNANQEPTEAVVIESVRIQPAPPG